MKTWKTTNRFKLMMSVLTMVYCATLSQHINAQSPQPITTTGAPSQQRHVGECHPDVGEVCNDGQTCCTTGSNCVNNRCSSGTSNQKNDQRGAR